MSKLAALMLPLAPTAPLVANGSGTDVARSGRAALPQRDSTERADRVRPRYCGAVHRVVERVDRDRGVLSAGGRIELQPAEVVGVLANVYADAAAAEVVADVVDQVLQVRDVRVQRYGTVVFCDGVLEPVCDTLNVTWLFGAEKSNGVIRLAALMLDGTFTP